ncbi:Vacuolar protein sorting-associated protein 26 [Corchorus capsularis]|uniref:Vacuolar protein sorting-associated protein 26 n=1 Tax=Corchorus capsularis TaxID=210143 RepID=A0A1R3G310_COCAP|nr:Vacuolar protein sorting-associated protein 26 [Corchorus capsularis]
MFAAHELDVPGEIYQRKTYPFEFSTVEMPYESLNGVNERLSFGAYLDIFYKLFRSDMYFCNKPIVNYGALEMLSSYFGSQMRLVYVKARECEEQLSPEEFAILLGKHFTSFYLQRLHMQQFKQLLKFRAPYQNKASYISHIERIKTCLPLSLRLFRREVNTLSRFKCCYTLAEEAAKAIHTPPSFCLCI